MQAKSGDTVKVHYIGTLADGSEFDSSTGQAPLEFTVGAGQLIPEFESCVIGTWHKKVGDKVAVGDELFSYETDKAAFDE